MTAVRIIADCDCFWQNYDFFSDYLHTIMKFNDNVENILIILSLLLNNAKNSMIKEKSKTRLTKWAINLLVQNEFC